MNKNSKRIIFTIFSIILISIFIFLGFWQVKRKLYKDKLIATINEQIQLSEIKYKDSLKEHLYRNLRFTGQFINTKKIFIYGSNGVNQKNGYFILTPFIIKDKKTILVVRGWIQDLNEKFTLQSKQEFLGMVVKSENMNFFTPKPDLEKNIFYSFDLQEIKKLTKIDLENFIVIDRSSYTKNQPNLEKFTNIYNRHFEYIITWFTLAFFMLIMLLYFLYGKKKN